MWQHLLILFIFGCFSSVGRPEGNLFPQPEATFVKEMYVFQ